MPRPLLIRSKIHPYHVTSRTHDRGFFPIPLEEVWKIMLKELYLQHQLNGLAIHAFVLMGNHFHLLCHTPKGNLDLIMQNFMRTTSIEIKKKKENALHLWEGRYRWSIIESQTHYFQVYRYIFQNPIRANICRRVEDYPYSSLKEVPFPLQTFVPLSFAGEEGELVWLNERYDSEDEVLIKLGLRRSQFEITQRKLKAFNRLSVPSKKNPD